MCLAGLAAAGMQCLPGLVQRISGHLAQAGGPRLAAAGSRSQSRRKAGRRLWASGWSRRRSAAPARLSDLLDTLLDARTAGSGRARLFNAEGVVLLELLGGSAAPVLGGPLAGARSCRPAQGQQPQSWAAGSQVALGRACGTCGSSAKGLGSGGAGARRRSEAGIAGSRRARGWPPLPACRPAGSCAAPSVLTLASSSGLCWAQHLRGRLWAV